MSTSDAKTVTLSFWVRSSLTGTFGGVILNVDLDRSYPFTYTISVADTWEYKTITIPGDTTGTWNKTNGIGLRVIFALGAGSDIIGTAGAWAAANYQGGATGQTNVISTSGATFYITGVQLETGTTATDFENLQYGTQLALCQRYYEVSGSNYGSNLCVAQNTTRVSCASAFTVPKRANPTVSVFSAAGANTVDAPGLSTVTVAIESSDIYGINFMSGTFVSGRPYLFYYKASAEL
jgi:hypothetical protein